MSVRKLRELLRHLPRGIAPWVACSACGDYLCSLHVGEHVQDCPCPPIETWSRAGVSPYEARP